LILPSPLPLSSFLSLTQEITGFFIVETYVLQTTGTFRSESEVEELWDALLSRLSTGLQWALKSETDPNEFLKVKECLIGFIMTLEVCNA
jgi:exocyst complex component 6